MQFSVKERDGPARIGELLVDRKRIVTPNILFVDTDRFKTPNYIDILIINNKRQKEKPTLQISNYFVYPKDIPKELHLLSIRDYKKDNKKYYVIPGNKNVIDDALKDNPASIFIVANALQLFQQPRKFTDFILELRAKIGYEKLIYFPSIGAPANFALLAYSGVDLFDSVSAILAARENILLFSNGGYNTNELHELPCSCPSCSKSKDKPCNMSFQNILSHNYFAILDELKQVRNAIYQGNLRSLVETRVKTNPNLTAVFRYLDANHYDFLEKRTPITSKSKVIATTKESMFRPEIRRFQKRVINRFRKPESAKILLLLPCSAKKPYSFSKSHRLYREKLNNSGNPFIAHEVIVTSPMGLVPRELELIYPASSYDIPVIGVWDEDEKKMIRDLLVKYLDINKYELIIAHLPANIMQFIEDILENSYNTCIDNPTSKKSLDKLSSTLKKKVNLFDKIKSQKRLREDIQGFASYQFGRKTAEKLLKDCIIKGKYPHKRKIPISKNNAQQYTTWDDNKREGTCFTYN